MEPRELVKLFKSTIRFILKNTCETWHSSLTQKQSENIETSQDRALRLAFGPLDYGTLLRLSFLPRLSQRHSDLCERLYLAMKDPSHKVHHRIPQERTVNYELRNLRTLHEDMHQAFCKEFHTVVHCKV